MNLSVSIVTYNNEAVIGDLLDSILNSTTAETHVCRVMVVDNASTDGTRDVIKKNHPDIPLISSDNIGFGAGHNNAVAAIKEKWGETWDYHLVVNPDIYFEKDALQKLIDFMETNRDVGLVMPRIYYPDNSEQFLCKMLPTPFDLMGRRFVPGFLKFLFKKRLEVYEFANRDYSQPMDVPHLSGCFMFMRSEVPATVGLFDERFFLYLEDVDLSRRIHSRFRTVYFPGAHVFHHYHKGSYKRWKPLQYHIVSAVKYFNKWGWFFDKDRKAVNEKAASGGQGRCP
ncbi:MAG: glycosyltransferase family 2 protein [bacterium]|nr:glycosyltransferase family 2 protein [bacterium]